MITEISCKGNAPEVIKKLGDEFLHLVGLCMYEHTDNAAKVVQNQKEFKRINEVAHNRKSKKGASFYFEFVGSHDRKRTKRDFWYVKKHTTGIGETIATCWGNSQKHKTDLGALLDDVYKNFAAQNNIEEDLKKRIEAKYAELCK